MQSPSSLMPLTQERSVRPFQAVLWGMYQPHQVPISLHQGFEVWLLLAHFEGRCEGTGVQL